MTKLRFLTLGLLLAIGFIACKDKPARIDATVQASKNTSIKKGEPVLFTLTQVHEDSIVTWSISPQVPFVVNQGTNQASILFSTSGQYKITGILGATAASTTVSVIDSVYDPTKGSEPPTTLNFADDDTIVINASKIDSGDVSGLIFSAITTKTYPCMRNSLLSTSGMENSNLTISYDGVSVPGGCTTGTANAAAFSYFYPITNDNSTISISFNGTAYTGTIVKTNNNYKINWNYTSGVIISPTSL